VLKETRGDPQPTTLFFFSYNNNNINTLFIFLFFFNYQIFSISSHILSGNFLSSFKPSFYVFRNMHRICSCIVTISDSNMLYHFLFCDNKFNSKLNHRKCGSFLRYSAQFLLARSINSCHNIHKPAKILQGLFGIGNCLGGRMKIAYDIFHYLFLAYFHNFSKIAYEISLQRIRKQFYILLLK